MRLAPDSHDEVVTPKPTHAKPLCHIACRTKFDDGLAYCTLTRSLYTDAGSATLTSRSNGCPSYVPTLRQRTLPPGNAPPVVSVTSGSVMI